MKRSLLKATILCILLSITSTGQAQVDSAQAGSFRKGLHVRASLGYAHFRYPGASAGIGLSYTSNHFITSFGYEYAGTSYHAFPSFYGPFRINTNSVYLTAGFNYPMKRFNITGAAGLAGGMATLPKEVYNFFHEQIIYTRNAFAGLRLETGLFYSFRKPVKTGILISYTKGRHSFEGPDVYKFWNICPQAMLTCAIGK